MHVGNMCESIMLILGGLASVLLQTLCKTEAANRPCPRIVLVCCTALVTGGLSAEGLFQQEASEDLVHFLFGAFEEGLPLSLPISGPY